MWHKPTVGHNYPEISHTGFSIFPADETNNEEMFQAFSILHKYKPILKPINTWSEIIHHNNDCRKRPFVSGSFQGLFLMPTWEDFIATVASGLIIRDL